MVLSILLDGLDRPRLETLACLDGFELHGRSGVNVNQIIGEGKGHEPAQRLEHVPLGIRPKLSNQPHQVLGLQLGNPLVAMCEPKSLQNGPALLLG